LEKERLRLEKMYPWRDENYWRLPENVRHAIDVAKMKSKHSEFWYKLQTLNDKIFIFRSIFYTKMPSYQRHYINKKQKQLEEEMQKQKEEQEQEIMALNAKTKKRKCNKSLLIESKFSKSAQRKTIGMTDDTYSNELGLTTMAMINNIRRSQGRLKMKVISSNNSSKNLNLEEDNSRKRRLKRTTTMIN